MKKALYYLLIALLATQFSSCKKDGESIDNTAEEETPGSIAPVGEADLSARISKSIGLGGGSLSSKDGTIKVEIPAGALESNQEVSIVPITNTNPLGINKGYRLEPHGVEFKKPVKITFSYTDEDIQNTLPEFLGIAYQDKRGVWRAIGGAQVNKTSKQISVNTTHFSDWTFFELLYMIPVHTTIEPGSSVDLKVVCDPDILGPLVEGKEYGINEAEPIPASRVKKWTLSGAGNLTSNGSTAKYKAPGTTPNPSTVAVTAEIDMDLLGKFLVVGHISIAGSFIEFQLGNSPMIKIPASPVVKFGGDYLLANPDNEGGGYFLLRWPGGKGTHGYTMENSGGHFHWLDGVDYVNYYLDDDKVTISGGSINITSMGEDDGWVEGTFTVSPTGSGKPFPRPSVNVSGRFRARKGFQ
ncbi:hypothetical protein [Desertivirga arenae]|uniref:hypothetical protein n=1 Tax=Desertivirga arenae TaxID=2810309 RepID=UPI001A95CE8E|nr:hypothetical protein [Pedobacter sp. SYSU D00823]